MKCEMCVGVCGCGCGDSFLKMELTACVDLKMTEITKKIGDMWAQESEEVKQVVAFDVIQS